MSVVDPSWGGSGDWHCYCTGWVVLAGFVRGRTRVITCLCWFNRLLGSSLGLRVLREDASCIN